MLSFPSGRELTNGHQLGLAGAVSLPVFWLAGAGAAVFWILGKYPPSLLVVWRLGCCDNADDNTREVHQFDELCFVSCVHTGATMAVIGSHAAFRELEQSDVEELLMEPV